MTLACALGVAALSACTEAPTTVSPTETGPNPGISHTSVPDPLPSLSPSGTPIALACDELITPDAMYEFNPNFGSLSDFTPSEGSIGAAAIEYSGIACRWQNQTSGDVVDMSVADLDSASLTSLEAEANSAGEPVPSLGSQAYFSVTDGTGVVTVFDGSFWLVATSNYFTEATDGAALVQSALTSLAG